MFGWSAGWLALGGQVIGFDIEHLPHHGDVPEGAELVLQDVLTIHGSQFRNADLIVASPPCQNYSYMAMPWSRAKAMAADIRADQTGEKREKLNALFNACFRIQREASEAAGHHIPMVVENVRGAQPWVGRSAWNFGSFHLWGDVPALMPIPMTRRMKRNPDGTNHPPGSWFAIADSKERGSGTKNNGGSWFNIANNTESGCGKNPVHALASDGLKVPSMNFHDHEKTGKPGRSFQSAAADGQNDDGIKKGGDWFSEYMSLHRHFSSKSPARKAESAQIAKIPYALSLHIAEIYWPERKENAA
jgi:hypothetical protein